MSFASLVTSLALLVWLYLILLHGQFWQSGPSLSPTRPTTARGRHHRARRDEAEVIIATLRRYWRRTIWAGSASFWL